MNIARSAGAMLPDKSDLSALAHRLAISSSEKNSSGSDGSSKNREEETINLERWALLYPGDATECLRWCCNMASAIDM
jgi:hypothetical protein